MQVYMLSYPFSAVSRENIQRFFDKVDWYSPYGGTIFFATDNDIVEIRKQFSRAFPGMFFFICRIDIGSIDGFAKNELWNFIENKYL